MNIALEPAQPETENYAARLRSAMHPVPSTAFFSDPNYFIWGASMVRDPEGICHLFYSRWPKEYGFNAWVTHSEIAHATAEKPLGPYTHRDVALPERGADFWDGFCTHNPTVMKHENKYYLYYTGNTGDRKPADSPDSWNWTHRNNQRIGVAVSDGPAGPWKRSDTPLIQISNNPVASDSIMASNPSITQRPDGGFLMIYKAVGKEYDLPHGGPVIHQVALSDHPLGPFIRQPDPIFTCDEVMFPAEDPFVWTQDGRYYAILKDMNGYFTDTIRALVLFESRNGLAWTRADSCVVSDRTVHFADGTVTQFDYLERPQLYLENEKPVVLFCAAREGDDTMNIHIPLTSIG